MVVRVVCDMITLQDWLYHGFPWDWIGSSRVHDWYSFWIGIIIFGCHLCIEITVAVQMDSFVYILTYNTHGEIRVRELFGGGKIPHAPIM